jgi:hypothetical protein
MPFFTLESIMKIRIDEVGYESYTGILGLVQFENGVSVTDVSQGELDRMAAVLRVVDADSDKQLGALVDYATASQVGFEQEGKLETGTGFVAVDGTIPASNAVETEKYTQEELEALADKEGITGLRAIGDSLNVKDTSIKGLIGSILNAVRKG